MRSFIFCPLDCTVYDTDIQLESVEECYEYGKRYGIWDFAMLDSCDLTYYGTIEIR